jgi:hypothetical protein
MNIPLLPKFVATIGTPRSASTWTFNIVRELLSPRIGTGNLRSIFAENLRTIVRNGDLANNTIIVKSHRITPAMMSLYRLSGAPIIISFRDPRDIIVSAMRFQNQQFDTALEYVTEYIECVLLYAGQDHLFLRYEDRFFEDRATLDRIAGKLGITISQEERDALYSKYDFENVKGFCENLLGLEPTRLVSGDATVWDKVSNFHYRHVGDGQVGKWRDILGLEEGKAASKRFQPFLARYGYELH